MSETRRRSVETFNRRNRLVNAKNRPRQFIHTPLGRALTFDEFLKPLVKFLAGERDEKPLEPPRFLREPIRLLEPSIPRTDGPGTASRQHRQGRSRRSVLGSGA